MSVESKYPKFNPELKITKTPARAAIQSAHGETDRDTLSWVNLDGAEALAACDGTETVAALASRLADEPGDERQIRAFVENAAQAGFVELLREPSATQPEVTGTTEYFLPFNLTLEITTACDLECDHCYRIDGDVTAAHMDYEAVRRLIDTLADESLVGVELTGGEATLHPRFDDILELCATSVDTVAVLTNGRQLTDDRVAEVEQYADTVVFSVSLDSHRSEFHNQFRGRPGSWGRTVEGIRRLVDAGFTTRVSMSVTPENATDMPDLAAFCVDLGVDLFTFTPVLPFGRGEADLWTPEDMETLGRMAERTRDEYGELLHVVDEEQFLSVGDQQDNCGAGWKSVAVDPQGRVRPCVMADAERDVIGEIDFERPKQVFADNAATAAGFFELNHPPEPGCDGCGYEDFCSGCVLRARRAYEDDHMDATHCSYRADERIAELVDA